jgi:aarF domain-containing kinase
MRQGADFMPLKQVEVMDVR